MELKTGSVEKVTFTLLKKRFMFESGDRGLVLEQADGVVCLYATDAAHGKIYCAMPMGSARDMKRLNYYIFCPDERKLLAAVGGALFVLDYAERWAASNLGEYRIYGSEYWEENCQRDWKGEYLPLFGLPNPDAGMDMAAAKAFWRWFLENGGKIAETLGGSGAGEVVGWVDQRLCPVFPYVPADAVQFELGWNNGKGEFFFFHNGNEKLLADGGVFASLMPEEIKSRWSVMVRE